MHDELDGAVDEIRKAAVRPELWPSAMEGLSSIFDCIGAVLEPETLSAHAVLPATDSLQAFLAAYLRDGWYKEDIRRERRLKQKDAPIILDQELVSPQEAQCLPLYQKLLKPFGLGYGACLRFGGRDCSWMLSLQRAASRGPFAAEEIRLMQALVPHLQQSGATALQLAARHDAGILSGLASVNAAAALIGSRCEIIAQTPGFARLLGNGIVLRHRRIATDFPRQDRGLQDLIASCLAASASEVAPRRLQIVRDGGKGPLIASVASLRRDRAEVFSEVAAVLTIHDPAEPVALPEDILAAQYALTRAEIRLACRLAGGATLASAAEMLDMSYQTARTHLKQIFSKLDVHKQSEMVALLRGLAAGPC